jgi:hypothetical protein
MIYGIILLAGVGCFVIGFVCGLVLGHSDKAPAGKWRLDTQERPQK